MEIFEMNGVADSFDGIKWDCDCKQCGPLKPLVCKKTTTSLQVNPAVQQAVQTPVYAKTTTIK